MALRSTCSVVDCFVCSVQLSTWSVAVVDVRKVVGGNIDGHIATTTTRISMDEEATQTHSSPLLISDLHGRERARGCCCCANTTDCSIMFVQRNQRGRLWLLDIVACPMARLRRSNGTCDSGLHVRPSIRPTSTGKQTKVSQPWPLEPD